MSAESEGVPKYSWHGDVSGQLDGTEGAESAKCRWRRPRAELPVRDFMHDADFSVAGLPAGLKGTIY